ncbi:MAG: PH domain-containing protein [Maioricimonas sp. JB045]|uniref:PH domain-containing protein n=1 Tax=Maioricimonas sp. JC845 TaxID=3232138 RepID=UPI00345B32ED
MATAVKPQAISGVSAGVENTIETVYPSVAATGLGRFFGRLYNSIPLKINGIKLSQILFCLPTAPIPVLFLYLPMKVGGNRYTLTNRSIQIWSALGGRMDQQMALTDIAEIEIQVQPGQEFFNAGDLALTNARGDVVMQLEGVPYPHRFRQIVLDARNARVQSDESLAAIQARG